MGGRLRRSVLAAAAVGAVFSAWAPGASAAPAITKHLNACPAYPSDTGQPTRICSGEVPSFDGSKLDVDVTLPNTGGQKHPLIVMLHGFGNNKHEWESTTQEGDDADKYHWNNKWFADHGYYVINYTARGFRDDGPTAPYQPDTPTGTSVDAPNGTIRVKSRDIEIKDTQYLAALVADAFPEVDPSQVAVTGGSYGGGESWLQASQSTWTFPHEVTKTETDPGLPVLQLQAAIPKYPWTDLSYALAPNGHGGGPSLNDPHESSQGTPRSDTGDGNPIGVPKLSFITGLFAVGNARGVFENGTAPNQGEEEPPPNIPAWNARLTGAGDPYDAITPGVEDPIVKQARRGLTEFRSAYYQDEGWDAQDAGRKVAVFSIQGWTDDLFEAVESFRMFKDLKRRDPRWPVEVALADIGHSRAQNKPAQWQRLNRQAWQWLQSNINGSKEQETIISSQPTICAVDGEPDRNELAAQELTAQTPESLSRGTLSVEFSGGKSFTNASGADDRDNERTDPVFGGIDQALTGGGGDCRTSSKERSATTGYTGRSAPLPNARTYIGLGEVEIPYTFAGAVGEVNARVWDVAPNGGPTLLVTRGTYRLQGGRDPASGTLRLPLFGNHYQLKPGHRIRIDLQEVDAPTFRPTNSANTFTFSKPTLRLPTRQSGDETLAGVGG